MKNLNHKVFFTVLFAFFTIIVYSNPLAQWFGFPQVLTISTLDHIDVTKLSLRSGTNSTYNYIGQPLAQNTLGTPTSINTEDWDMLDGTATIYNYSGAKVEYFDGKMYGYEITSSSWSVGAQEGPYIKIGANLNSLASLLPNYNSNKVNGTFTAPIVANGIVTDSYLYIEFNQSTLIITKISLRDY